MRYDISSVSFTPPSRKRACLGTRQLSTSTDDAEAGRRRWRGRRTNHLQNPAVRITHHVELAIPIDPERADVPELREAAEPGGVLDQVRGSRLAAHSIDGQRDRPDPALNEIREEVPAPECRRERAAAIDVPAGNRFANGVVVLVNRFDERQVRRRARRDVVVSALAVAPPIVPPSAVRRLVVSLFPSILPDVADDDRAGAAA